MQMVCVAVEYRLYLLYVQPVMRGVFSAEVWHFRLVIQTLLCKPKRKEPIVDRLLSLFPKKGNACLRLMRHT